MFLNRWNSLGPRLERLLIAFLKLNYDSFSKLNDNCSALSSSFIQLITEFELSLRVTKFDRSIEIE